MEFAFKWHRGVDDDRNWEYDKEDVCDDVAYAQGEELTVALPAMWSRIRTDSPVITEWVAFEEIGEQSCQEC